MSIIVKNVSKQYGSQWALDNVSFEIPKGQIVGFLGPNGAGKSTMMKIITSFIPSTSGKVEVNGFDVATKSMDSRRIIGYLPEHNPLYLEMYVREYLAFMAGIYKMDNIHGRVENMIERVGLGVEAHKKIGTLSKGYRQRVGLAQALIHDPQVLILDEPTSGLDPNQLIEIRSLIQDMGKEKTVMFSTHIMQEVEAICSRAIIINKGKLIADQSTQDLKKFGSSTVLHIEIGDEVSAGFWKSIDGVEGVRNVGPKQWELVSRTDKDLRRDVSDKLSKSGYLLLAMSVKEQRLEDIFKDLTNNK
ncbi:MAG: gliding motility-associated ABC transporter ATP-binding subunit GldA [Bacteroidetes bacterium]|nr:gliding motility-associated ABC transporter ATP-binding subunit GldA [Bacteroidota bacterium]